MCSETAIRVDKLGKCYAIYAQPRDRLKQFLLPRLQRLAGLPAKQYFREFWALREVSFTIGRGETVGIIGRNGSGKSTLLQMICQTLTPSCGAVETRGRIAALLELGSGFNPEFSGRENVYMNAALLGLTKAQIEQRFDAIAVFADIGEFIEQPVKIYSSGMLVRLAFAVIAHVDADILVIDEALAVGDAAFSRKCFRFLREFMEHGTVLFVSHDIASIKSLCQRAIWLEGGQIAAQGDPKTVSERYLKHIYEAPEQVALASAPPPAKTRPPARDMRRDFINASNLRNDIEVLEMRNERAAFGQGGVCLGRTCLEDESGAPLSWVVGGEMVQLVVEGIASESIENAIIGFVFKDRLGQFLFGDNSFLSFLDAPVSIRAGEGFRAVFRFVMPILRAGDYSIDVAVADGTPLDHIQQLWVHDSVLLKSTSSSVCTGLVGIPMMEIDLEVLRD